MELERDRYYEGIDLFNRRAFFEAHEVWEEIWVTSCGTKREFYQGLIQCSVALEHYRRSNPRGVVSLYKSYARHFQNVPSVFMGLDVRSFLLQMHEVLRDIVEANLPFERGDITLDANLAPTIILLYDPFETGEGDA